MKQTIYADVLLALNFFINYFLLLSVGRIMRSRLIRTRVCLASTFGALCSLTLFLPPMHVVAECLLKLAISSAMVLIAFRQSSAKVFVRYLLVTCAVTFGFGGAMLALWLTVAPRGMFYRNGTVYFSMSPEFVIAVTVMCYTIITVAGRICRRLELRTGECSAVIRTQGKVRSLRLIYDTGNLLTEPFSGLPVIVAKRNSLGKAIPSDFPADKLYGHFFDQTVCDTTAKNLRVIPYAAVGGEGLLCAFRPESVDLIIGRKKRRHIECYIAVSDDLGQSEYDGIINPAIIEN